jgi:hypothetical protein
MHGKLKAVGNVEYYLAGACQAISRVHYHASGGAGRYEGRFGIIAESRSSSLFTQALIDVNLQRVQQDPLQCQQTRKLGNTSK